MLVGRYWWLKVIVLSLVLAGVLWMMSSLQDGSYFRSPSSPVQVLIGDPAETSGSDPNGTPAKVQFESPDQNTEPTK